jgi:zinc transport system substrate-binding protein
MALAALAPLVGCGDDGGGTADPVEGAARIEVVAAFYPLAEAAERVGGDWVAVADLTPPGAEPHDVELTTRQVDAVEDADVVVVLGGGFQPAVEGVARRAGGVVVDVLGDGESEDPHVWLDPVRMQAIAAQVAAALVEADPAGADVYRRNAGQYGDELAAVDAEYADGLRDCDRTAIVTAHAAFGALAARYGLTQESLTGRSPEAEPDPRRLAELADFVESEGVTTIFTEPLVTSDLADTLARETGATTAVLDPIEGLTDEQLESGVDYASVMGDNLAALRLALGCR